MPHEPLTVGSLFSGIGGIDLGLERAGMVTRWFVEWDEWCQGRLRRHWPGLPVYGDITAVDWGLVESVDVLAGGFPCQPVSAAGLRKAQEDDRWLWPAFADAIRILRPRYVLVENVRNLLAVNDGSAAREVVGDLATLGYDAHWDCIPASAFGAPHERDRLWIVAYADERGRERHDSRSSLRTVAGRDGQGSALAHASSDGRTGRRNTDAGRHAAATGRQPLRTQPAGDGRGDSSVADPNSGRRNGRTGAFGSRRGTEPPNSRVVAHPDQLHAQGLQRRGDDQDQRQEPTGRSLGLCGGGRCIFWPAESRVGGDAHGLPDWMDRHRWPAPPGPQFDWEPPRTVPARAVKERAARVKALGNAVVPQVVEWIGRRIVAFDAAEELAA
jgi:site-specific DNA-cytosine methylase